MTRPATSPQDTNLKELNSIKSETQMLEAKRRAIFDENGKEIADVIKQAQFLNRKLTSFDSVEQSWNPTERALVALLRGKLLDLSPKYNPESEEALIKAVKLDPNNVEAWNTLGHTFWKKGDLETANNCFQSALKRDRNKRSLQELSMLKRSLAKGNVESALQLVEESVQNAKEAVAMDVKDTHSWYCLGNAFLSLYFQGGTADPAHLHSSLKAYQRADGEPNSPKNPDLHFNRAMVHRYLENYQLALQDLVVAGKLDPSLPWQKELEELRALVTRLHTLVETNGQLKPKRLQSIVNSLAVGMSAPPGLRVVGVGALSEGPNPRVCVCARIIQSVTSGAAVPLYFLMVDHEGKCFTLSVLGLSDECMKPNTTITLLEPNARMARCELGGKVAEFICIRVEGPKHLLVAGGAPLGFQASPTLERSNIG